MAGTFDPNQAQNLVEIEKQFAVKAVEHAQTYWNLLEKIPPRELKLTRYDDEIFEHTLRDFPEFAAEPHTSLVTLDENWIKSKEGKERWRSFINAYEKKITDFNFGSLIRTDSTKEYNESNTIFGALVVPAPAVVGYSGRLSLTDKCAYLPGIIVTRIQFYAIEISRNRLGLNDGAHELAKEAARKERENAEKKKAGKKKSDDP